MMTERRHYPRLNAHMLWRPARPWMQRHDVEDVSLGGARVYSDDLLPVGVRLEIELLVPGSATIELLARVVRVTILRPTGPAFCDVAFEFVNVTDEAKSRLAGWLGSCPPS